MVLNCARAKVCPSHARSVPRFRAVPGSHRFIAFTKGMPSPLALYMASCVVCRIMVIRRMGKLTLTHVCRPLA